MGSTTPTMPSRLRLAQLALAAIGFADSVYLTYLKWSGSYASCIGAGDCELVNQSRFSELFGQPVALWGALAYLALIGLTLLEPRIEQLTDMAPAAVFALTTFGVLYSGYLTYIEFGVLQAYCPYCLLSAGVMLVLWIVAIARLRNSFAVETT